MATLSNPVYSFTPEALSLVGEARLAYVRKVYTYFLFAVLSAIGGTVISMQSGLAISFMNSPFIGMIVFIGMTVFAAKSSSSPTRAVPTLSAAAFVSGLIIAPTLFAIAHGYVRGMSENTIWDALIMSGAVFGGLTMYTFVSKKDFSYMGASLTIGLFMLIGAMVLNFFLNSSTLDLSIAFIGVIIFSGFILVDTSRILKRAHEVPPTLAALSLYLDFLNLFMMLLRILGGGRGGRR